MKFDANVKFGIEIEIREDGWSVREEIAQALREAGIVARAENYGHTTMSYWKVINDGSCGSEIVSPPLKGYEGLAEVETVCRVLNGLNMSVNKSCGFHVHHDADGMNRLQIQNVVALYTKWEKVIDLLMPPSRRGNDNQYCRSHLNPYEELGYTIHNIYRYDPITANGRYMKVNTKSYERHGTIEFRQHSGTIDFDKIKAWIVITQNFITKAKKNSKAVRSVSTRHISIKRFRDWIGCTGRFVEDGVSSVAADWMMARFRHWTQIGLYESVYEI